ncbi:MAG: YciI family protein [Actinobacteria bacterium]|nr:YciI family protein [Actinomycetota bacterium]
MRYLLLIYTDPDLAPSTPEAMEADMGRWFAYTEDLRNAGVHLAGEALQPATTATTVRVRNDETLTTDGPFAETKEVLGGFYLIDVADLDDALKWAAACPGAGYGSMEVRPIMEFDAP